MQIGIKRNKILLKRHKINLVRTGMPQRSEPQPQTLINNAILCFCVDVCRRTEGKNTIKVSRSSATELNGTPKQNEKTKRNKYTNTKTQTYSHLCEREIIKLARKAA